MALIQRPFPAGDGGTGVTTTPTDGQLLIGNSSTNAYTLSSLTAGANITITGGHGSITIAAASGFATVDLITYTFCGGL